MDSLRNELRQIPCLSDPPEDLDTLVSDLNAGSRQIIERHAP